MGQLRVPGGCIHCKARRKKCPEQRPRCDSCLRLSLKCSYRGSPDSRPYSSKSFVVGTYRVQSPVYQIQQLPATTFTSGRAEAAIASVPPLLADLFLPTYAYGDHSIHEVMQITLSSTHVSNACMAGLLGVWNTQAESDDLVPAAQMWNQASRSVRALVDETHKDERALVKSLLAILFMGASESIGTGFANNLTLHFEAGTKIINRLQASSAFGWSSMPSNLRIFTLEYFLYQATLCMFLPEAELRSSYPSLIVVHRLLTELNPPSDFCIDKSPFYAGFYDVYLMLVEVVLLHRSTRSTNISQTRVDALEKQILQIRHSVSATISRSQTANMGDLARLMQLYSLCCTVLVVCVNALRPPSEARDSRIAAEIQKGLQILTRIRPTRERVYTLAWPVQMLMCAVSSTANMVEFETTFDDLRSCFSGSSLTRTEALRQRVLQIRLQPASENEKQIRIFSEDTTIPRGMLLFRQKGGVLAREF